MTIPTPALNIPSLVDQETGERNAMALINGLSFLDPSPECREAIMPFLCLFIFSLCDSRNNLHSILRNNCLELRDDICLDEWSQAVGFLGEGVLPVCEDLPDAVDECTGKELWRWSSVSLRKHDCIQQLQRGFVAPLSSS